MSVPWRKIKESIRVQSPLIVAVSGGRDSMFLLHLVNRCGVDFAIAHFDHDLGHDDPEFVQQIAAKYNVPYFTAKGQGIALAPSVEAEARNQRYAFLRSVLEETKRKRIVLGHHKDDQVETILLRLMRGYPQTELGMPALTDTLFRPLLGVTREEIKKQSEYFGIEFREDPSNTDTRFERNWLRHEILPRLMERRNVRETIFKGWTKTGDKDTELF